MDPTLLTRLEIILVGTAEPMNLGAAARAVKNCGLSRLALVAPRTSDLVTARRVAVHAEELLQAPPTLADLKAAIAGASWVVGTSSRILPGRPILAPREVAERAAGVVRAGGRVALVFGGEASGLSNRDLLVCHDLARIPANDAQPSYNLAQAVLLFSYEMMLALERPSSPAPERAADGEVGRLERPLRELLVRAGFAEPDRPRHGVLDLLQTLRRAGLSPAESRLWEAALHAAAKALRGRE